MRTRKFAIPNDYFCYLQKVEYDLGDEDDPVTYKSDLWKAATSKELASIASNHVWTLVDGSDTKKAEGCKWVFKTKRDGHGRIEKLKA